MRANVEEPYGPPRQRPCPPDVFQARLLRGPERLARGDHRGAPQGLQARGPEAPPRPQPGRRRGRGQVQRGERGVPGPVVRGEARDLRPLRPRRPRERRRRGFRRDRRRVLAHARPLLRDVLGVDGLRGERAPPARGRPPGPAAADAARGGVRVQARGRRAGAGTLRRLRRHGRQGRLEGRGLPPVPRPGPRLERARVRHVLVDLPPVPRRRPQVKNPCGTCAGQGVVERPRKVTVHRSPPGSTPARRLQVPGAGRGRSGAFRLATSTSRSTSRATSASSATEPTSSRARTWPSPTPRSARR